MKLTVIIPVFNERKTIAEIIARVKNVAIEKEIIIVDDGSRDGTSDYLRSLADPEIIVLFHEKNRGKGAAIRTALTAATGEAIVIQDGDLEYDPQDFIPLFETYQEKKAMVVYGSRILSKSRMSYLRFWLGGRFITWVCNLLYGSRITDEPTCYKLINTSLIKQLKLEGDGFEFCPEVTGKILRSNIPIFEIPISYNPRTLEEGKKIRWKDGLVALWYLLKIRINPPPCINVSGDPDE